MEVKTNYNKEELKTNSVRGMFGVIQFKISHIPDLYNVISSQVLFTMEVYYTQDSIHNC
jgi:hypothetical protein